MLSEDGYAYLKSLLLFGKIILPQPATIAFSEDFIPVHLKCYQTAMQVAVETGYPPVIGIQFIDLQGKLYPWPHMVNRRDDGLIDCSPRPNQPLLGFVETGWEELPQWRQIVMEYNALADRAEAPNWGDPLADRLTHEFMGIVRAAGQLTPPETA